MPGFKEGNLQSQKFILVGDYSDDHPVFAQCVCAKALAA
jgi:hypothetical protein